MSVLQYSDQANVLQPSCQQATQDALRSNDEILLASMNQSSTIAATTAKSAAMLASLLVVAVPRYCDPSVTFEMLPLGEAPSDLIGEMLGEAVRMRSAPSPVTLAVPVIPA